MIAGALKFYQRWISPPLHLLHGSPGACRFVPTCSEYAAEALGQYGLLSGLMLAGWRLLRCNPLCRGGLDPVPKTFLRQRPPQAKRSGTTTGQHPTGKGAGAAGETF